MKIKEGGNGTNRSTVDGRTTKDQFTRRLKSCPSVIRTFREKVNRNPRRRKVFGTWPKYCLQSFLFFGIFSRDNPHFHCNDPGQPLNYAPRDGCARPRVRTPRTA